MPKSKKPAPKTTIGTVHPKQTLFLTMHVGEANDQNGHKYALGTAANCGSPIVYSETSTRFWTVNWDELLRLAIAAGIDTPE